MGWRSIRAALCPIMRGRRTGVRSVSKLREMIMAGICRGGENAAVLMQKVGHKGQRANVKRVGRGDGEGAAMEESGRLVIHGFVLPTVQESGKSSEHPRPESGED